MTDFDPRLTPARPDLAASHLKNKVEADRYVDGRLKQVMTPSTALRRSPQHDAELDTELLLGECFTVYTAS